MSIQFSLKITCDMDGLAYRLHRPTDCGLQAWVHSLLTGVIPSHRIAWVSAALDHLFGGCEAPGLGHLTWC
jgi:hypothetical protein